MGGVEWRVSWRSVSACPSSPSSKSSQANIRSGHLAYFGFYQIIRALQIQANDPDQLITFRGSLGIVGSASADCQRFPSLRLGEV